MKKRELVHIHALLDRIRRFIAARDDLDEGGFEEYKRLGVAPAAVYKSKGAHESAVTTLSEALADAIENGGDSADGTDESSSESRYPGIQSN